MKNHELQAIFVTPAKVGKKVKDLAYNLPKGKSIVVRKSEGTKGEFFIYTEI